MIFEHDANLSLVSQIFDEGVSQQGVGGWSMQMVLDQTAIDKRQETLRPVRRQKETAEERGQREAETKHVRMNTD